jgi:hypothetical protein
MEEMSSSAVKTQRDLFKALEQDKPEDARSLLLGLVKQRGTNQLRLVGHESRNALNTLIEARDFILMNFFKTFCWPPGRPLRSAQEAVIEELTEDALGIASVAWSRSLLICLTTGGGKSIAIDFLAAAMSATHIHTNNTKAMCGVLIVAVPTIALATETHVRLQQTWQGYSRSRYELGEHPILPKFPPIHVYKSPGGSRPYPLIKLLAGANSTENLYLTIREAGDTTSAATTTRKIPFVIVATYEHALGLLHKWSDPLGPGVTDTYGDHIRGLVIDEAHYATDSDRPAPRALVRWARYRKVFTVFLTGTPTPNMVTLLDLPRDRMLFLTNERRREKVVAPLVVFSNEQALIQGTVPFVVGGFMRSLLTGRRKRMAVFIENKMLLKILLCVTYHTIISLAPTLLPGVDPYIKHGRYTYLRQAMSIDPAVLCDETAYGQLISSEYAVHFDVAYRSMANWGILMVTADFGSLTRRNLTAILSNIDIPYSVVLTTSALAEGVNMCCLHTAYIAVISKKNGVGANVVKIVQELGRQDREDTGGITYLPTHDEVKEIDFVIPNIVMMTDLFGKNVKKETLTNFMASEKMPLGGLTVKLFSQKDLLRMYPDTNWATVMSKILVVLDGYQCMPYHDRYKYLTIPGLYDMGDSIVPCLMLRVMRLFRRGNNFNMHVMAMDVRTVRALQIFPCATQIMVVTILLQMRQYVSQTDIQMTRNTHFAKFIQTRRIRLNHDSFTKQFVEDLFKTCQHIAALFNNPKYSKFDFNGINMCRPHIEDWNMHAIAVYVTEITLSSEGWDHITSEWAVYDVMFANSMSNFDAFVDILVDNPVFPILLAQQSQLSIGAKKYPDLAEAFNHLYSMIQDYDVALWTLGDFHSEILCGVPMSSTVKFNAFTHTPATDRLGVVTENPVLMLLAHSARVLTSVFQVTDTQTFSAAREASTKSATRSLSANVDHVPYGCESGQGVMRCLSVDAYSRIIETPEVSIDRYIHSALENIQNIREANTL